MEIKVKDRLHYLSHKTQKQFTKQKARGWSGISILVFSEDKAHNPRRLRINYYVVTFVGVMLLVLPIFGTYFFIKNRIEQKRVSEIIESRRALLTGLKLLTTEKRYLLSKVEDQIYQYQKLSGPEHLAFLKEVTQEAVEESKIPDDNSIDTLSRDLNEIQNLRSHSQVLLDQSAYYSLNYIWNRMSIHHRTPRGRPLHHGVGNITSTFGSRPDPFNMDMMGEFHTGIDFAASKDIPIMATAPGTVVVAEEEIRSGYGYYIKIHHGYGITTLYAHCSKLLVQVGQEVKRGEVIALMGSTGRATGNHVHYEVHTGLQSAQDPMEYVLLK